MKSFRRLCKPEKFEYAFEMRHDPTPAEAHLWPYLKALRCPEFKFRRQAVILGWIIDFYSPSKRLAVEVDGGYHNHPRQREKDDLRDRVLQQRLGIKTLRFTNEYVLANRFDVTQAIRREAEARPTFASWNAHTAIPSRGNASEPGACGRRTPSREVTGVMKARNPRAF